MLNKNAGGTKHALMAIKACPDGYHFDITADYVVIMGHHSVINIVINVISTAAAGNK